MRNAFTPFALTAALTGVAALAAPAKKPAAPAPAATGQVAILLYDSRNPEQVELRAAAVDTVKPHKPQTDLRPLDVSKPTAPAQLRAYGLFKFEPPMLALMRGVEPKLSVAKKVPLTTELLPADSARAVLAALKLPSPKVEAVTPGPVISIVTDGGEEERKQIVGGGGAIAPVDGVRMIAPGGLLTYRFRLPQALRQADLRLEIGGNYRIQAAYDLHGPWTAVLDSEQSLGPAADSVEQRLTAVADLNRTLENLSGALYLRVASNGKGRKPASLAKIEILALAPGQSSGAVTWAQQADALRKARLATLIPAGVTGTLLSGTYPAAGKLEAKKSPYLMTGDVNLPYGSMLLIEPGVTIRIVGEYRFNVQGQLRAQGTSAEPIVFEPAAASGTWGGIRFLPLPKQMSGKTSLLEYCRVKRSAGVELNHFAGEVVRCNFDGGQAGIILRNGGTGKVHHNRFARLTRGISLNGGSGDITDNVFDACLFGLFVDSAPIAGAFKFAGNSILNSRIGAVNYAKTPGKAQPALDLPGNHWEGDEKRLVPAGVETAEIKLDPRLPMPPTGVGPGW